MAAGRAERIRDAMAARGERPDARALCEVAASVTSLTGAGLAVIMDGSPRGSLGASDAASERMEELQYVLGEGPCLDAHRQDHPVLEPDLASPAEPRWPAFSAAAVDAGVRAVFGFPVRIGSTRLGALDLYRDQPGPLTGGQHADCLVLADLAAQAMLGWQERAPTGELAVEFQRGDGFRWVVHQAAGMVGEQLGTSADDALVAIRAYAFAHDRRLTDVADDIVARRLRLG